jgi:hypothetical protein
VTTGDVITCIVVVRSWDLPIAPLRDALEAAGVHAELRRVDTEPALAAELGRREVGLIVHAPSTRGIPRATVVGLLRDVAIEVPIVVYDEDDATAVARRVTDALHSARH